MYAAVRDDIKCKDKPSGPSKTHDPIGRRLCFQNMKNKRGEPTGIMRESSNRNCDKHDETTSNCKSPMGSRTTKTTEIDEWELLEETLGDTNNKYYFSRQSTQSNEMPNSRSQDDQGLVVGSVGSRDHGPLSPVGETESGRSDQGRVCKAMPDWRSLPDCERNNDDWSERREEDEDRREYNSLERSNGELGTEIEDQEDDDQPFTTLDSIIAAAKRLSVSSVTKNQSSSSMQADCDRINQPSGADGRAVFADQPAKQSNGNVSDGRITSSPESTLNDGLSQSAVQPRSMLSRGFTWNSTDSTDFIMLTMRSIRRLPPPESSFVGSLDSS